MKYIRQRFRLYRLLLLSSGFMMPAVADTTPPSLISLSASSPVNAPGPVTLTAILTDAGVGINTDWIYGILVNPYGGGQVTVNQWVHLGGDTYQGTADIGPGALPGVWKVHSLLAYDNNRNGSIFLNGVHQNAGFLVINPNPDGNPPMMHSVAVAPNPGTLNTMATVTIVVSDDVSGVELTNLYVNLTHESGAGHSQVADWTPAGLNAYTGTTTLNPKGPPGNWIVHSVTVRDKVGNTAVLMNGVDYTSTFQVINPSMPDIYLQPFSQQVTPGETVVFNVSALGTPPLFYQWNRNSLPIPGAASTSYYHSVSSDAEHGDEYTVIVSNANGSVTSRSAVVRMRNGNYQGIIASQFPDHWYRMDGDTADSGMIGGSPLLFDGGDFGHGGRFDLDFEHFESLAYYTDGGQDVVYQTNDIIQNVGSISLLIRTPDRPFEEGKNRAVFNQGAGSPNGFYLNHLYPSTTFRLGNASMVIDSSPLETNAWYYFGASWDIPAGVVNYAFGLVGGSLQTGMGTVSTTANAGLDDNILALANKSTGPYDSWFQNKTSGSLDEVAIWHSALSPLELAAQFAALTLPSGSVAIVSHPVSQQIPDGGSGHFSVLASGQAPIYYQWLKDGTPIAGATNTDFSLIVTAADNGTELSVLVSNAIGVATSLPAAISVTPVRAYQEVLLSQVPDYWFPLDSTLGNFGSRPADDLTSIGNGVAGSLPQGTDNVGHPASAFDLIGTLDHLAQSADIVADRGSCSLLFRTPSLPFDGPNRYVLSQLGTTSDKNALRLRFSDTQLALVLGSKSTKLIDGQPLQDTWYYFAMVWDESNDAAEATWYLAPLGAPLESGIIDIQDDDVIGDGGAVYFGHRNGTEWNTAFRQDTASGTVDEIAFWSRELTLEEIQLQFQSHTTRYMGPTITTEPADTTVDAFSSALFSVDAAGIGELTYQWLINGAAMPGESNAFLNLPFVTVAMSNNQYRVIVGDSYGSVTSATATLSVIPPPPNLPEMIASLNPDYWFRFEGDYTNAGGSAAADFIGDGTGFSIDAYGSGNAAVRMEAADASLEQADLIGQDGTLVMLFRTPDAQLLTAHLLAQGTNTGFNNALNLVHIDSTGLELKAGDASMLVYTSPLPRSTWFYLALSWDDVRDAGEVRWWLGKVGGTLAEGVLDIGNTAAIGDGTSWILGNSQSGGSLPWRRDDGSGNPGSIDEVALWTTELAAASITNLFAGSAVGGPRINLIVGGAVNNGDFNADTSTVDSRTYAVTPSWENTGTSAPDQSATATRLNLTYNGTRNAQINDGTAQITGMDTGYIITQGDVFDVSYVWLDALNWADGTDRISVKLFITDNDMMTGTRTYIATSLSGTSTANNTYEAVNDFGFYTAAGSAAGKKLFVEINGEDGNFGLLGFARVDEFVLVATTPGGTGGGGGGSGIPLTITQMRISRDLSGQFGVELLLDTEPSRYYDIEWMDVAATGGWQKAETISATGTNVIWYDTGNIGSGRPSPLDLPSGTMRSYRYREVP